MAGQLYLLIFDVNFFGFEQKNKARSFYSFSNRTILRLRMHIGSWGIDSEYSEVTSTQKLLQNIHITNWFWKSYTWIMHSQANFCNTTMVWKKTYFIIILRRHQHTISVKLRLLWNFTMVKTIFWLTLW